MTAEEVFNKVKRFKPYFKNGGGVTFSGGEPLLNADFINEIYPMFRKEGIGYCIDTSGSVELSDSVEEALSNADLVILDIKFYNPEDYKKYTGGDFTKFMAVAHYCSDNHIALWLRTVIVPGINDSEKDIDGYYELIKDLHYEKYELLPFHTMGFFKYDELGIENPLKCLSALNHNRLTELQKHLDRKAET